MQDNSIAECYKVLLQLQFTKGFAGKQAKGFSLGASLAPKTKLFEAQPKTEGPKIQGKMKLISIPYGIAKHLFYSYLKSETLKICIPLIIYHIKSIWN